MAKNDRTVKGRAANPGRNLHELPTKILERPKVQAPTPDSSRRRATPREVAVALAEFRKTAAAKRLRGQHGEPPKKR